MDTQPMDYRCGEYLICIRQRQVRHEGRALALEAKVFDLIALLIEHREQALDKQQIVAALWGHRPVTDAALTQLVYKARRVFDDDGEHQAVIRTVYGRGLQWVAAVEPIPEPASAPAPASALAPAAPSAASTRRRWLPWAVAAVAIVAGALIWRAVPRSGAVLAPPAPRLALLPIDNTTGEDAVKWTSHGLPGLMASLLGSTPDLSVVDPLQVAKVWAFTVPAGTSHLEHVRKATGATILVSGRLRKLSDLYELSLHIQRHSHADRDITLTGSQPGALAVAAVPRIRRVLGLEPLAEPVLGHKPSDTYLAQTFARGMDAGMHGLWAQARPYFELCARETPDFLPCRLRLGEAQASTDQLGKAEQTLKALLHAASDRGDTGMVANARFQLASAALTRHRHASALQYLDAAAPSARQIGDVDLEVKIALHLVDVAARLQRYDLARQQLDHARDLIHANGLRDREGDLYNSEGFLAQARGEFAAAEKANRKALAASTAIGNEADAVGDAYNLGLSLRRQGRTDEALPLFAYTFARGGKLGNPHLEFGGGDNLAIVLLNAGASNQVPPIVKRLLAIGKQTHNAVWQALAWVLRAARQRYDGEFDAARASAQQSMQYVDADQDPALWVALQYTRAMTLMFADPGALPDLAHAVDAVVARQPTPSDYAYPQQLIHALAASAGGHAHAAREALRKAGTLKHHPNDPTHDDWRRAGLAIALVEDDPAAARMVLADFDPGQCDQADVLQLAAQWARQQGDKQAEKAAEQRLAFLRKSALAALQQTKMATSKGS